MTRPATEDALEADDISALAEQLCMNRVAHRFDQQLEDGIRGRLKTANRLDELTDAVIALLHGEKGDLRVGAAELLGSIATLNRKEQAAKALSEHLDDDHVRSYTYHGSQSDESDERSVARSAQASIDRLNRLSEAR